MEEAANKPWKIVLINRTGNAGKSSWRKHVLAPNLPDANVWHIDPVNRSGGGGHRDLLAERQKVEEEFRKLANEVVGVGRRKSHIIDIGSQETAVAAIDQFGVFSQLREKIEMWLVVTMPDTKMIEETLDTIDGLESIGVNMSKVIVAFNNVAFGPAKLREVCGAIYDGAKERGYRVAEHYLKASDAVKELFGKEQSIYDIATVSVNFDQLLDEAEADGNENRIEEIAKAAGLRDLAIATIGNATTLFNSLPCGSNPQYAV